MPALGEGFIHKVLQFAYCNKFPFSMISSMFFRRRLLIFNLCDPQPSIQITASLSCLMNAKKISVNDSMYVKVVQS